ncbi:MAG: tetraacyldisaccharide 4'-kinase [Sedimenticola sp.]
MRKSDQAVKRLDYYWYSRNGTALLLLPLSWIFCLISWLRRLAYRLRLLPVHKSPVPVIVVGNITVGGTGKTPLVIWLADHLRQQGFRPGIVSRGYGGNAESWPQTVESDSDPSLVGDEPVMIAHRTGCPMWVGPDRPAVARALLQATDCDIIISDDGLQHYALGRDIEIAVVDGKRLLGNGFCLPAGPLRESEARLDKVDILVVNDGEWRDGHQMTLEGGRMINLKDPSLTSDLAAFSGYEVHGIAGIGHPRRFFDTLRRYGLKVIEHPFDDHHQYSAQEITPGDELSVVMTEKDAVKCGAFAQEHHWYLEVDAKLGWKFSRQLDSLLASCNARPAGVTESES